MKLNLFNQAVLIHDQKSRQKLKYLENGKSVWGEIKSIFHHFKGLSVAKKCLRPDSAPLRIEKFLLSFHIDCPNIRSELRTENEGSCPKLSKNK